MRSLLLSAALICSTASAATVQVFLAAGQSNANAAWAGGIESTFNSLLGSQNVEVVNSQHGGSSMWMWSSAGARGNHYNDDLAAVQATMAQIILNGDTPEFGGILWMQGEGDIMQPSTIPIYDDRFRDMLSFYQQDLGLSTVPNFIVGVVDANTADPAYSGVNPANVEALRQALFALGEEPNGAAYDTRGFDRTDLWHLNVANSTTLGNGMAYQFAVIHNVPEPTAAILSAAGILLALRRRRA